MGRSDIHDTRTRALSEEQRYTLQLLAEGLQEREIADACCIHVRTVRARIRNCYAKLDLEPGNMRKLVWKALKEGLITVHE